jgi:molybdate transport system substrate-binding protein
MTTENPLKIFSGGAMRPLLRELVPCFEGAHAVTIEVEYRLSAAVKRAIQDGAAFDLAVLPRPELDELIASGAIMCEDAADVARSTVGLAVRAAARHRFRRRTTARADGSALDRLQ